MTKDAAYQGTAPSEVGALILHEADDVATALRDLKAHERVWVQGADLSFEIELIENIPLCHKLALRPLFIGQSVKKYGENIGVITRAAPAGAHVHIQNLKSARALLL